MDGGWTRLMFVQMAEDFGLKVDQSNVDQIIYESIEPSSWGSEEDEGVCLSLHQPWASLLVYGFKRAEGRVWNTEYRGR